MTTRHLDVWIVPGAALVALGVLGAGPGNLGLFRVLNAIGPATNETAWASLTVLGNTVVCLALCLPFWRRRPDLLWSILVSALISTAVVNSLKPLLDVSRPVLALGDSVHVIGTVYKKYAFPSGHSATLFIIAAILWRGGLRRRWAIAALVTATVASLSRCVVGAHWPTDVLGGAAIGWLSGMLGLEVGTRSLSLGARSGLLRLGQAGVAGCAVVLLVGYDAGYPQASLFQRTVAAACLAVAAMDLRPTVDRG